MCLQRFICSLVFNAALAQRPVNRPAFPFSGGASGAEDGTHEPVPEILGDGGLIATRTHAQPGVGGELRGELVGQQWRRRV